MKAKSEPAPQSTHFFEDLGELFKLVKPYKRDLSLIIIALLVTALMVLFLGKVIKYLIDLGFVQSSNLHLDLTLAAFVLGIVTMAVAGYYRSYLTNSVAEKIIADLRKKVYGRVIRVSPEFFEQTKTGDIVARLTISTNSLYNIISNTIPFFLRNLMLFLGGISFLFLTSSKLTIITFALIPLAISPVLIIGDLVKKLANQSQRALAGISARIEESVSGIKTIQSYLCEEKEIRNFHDTVNFSLDIAFRKIKIRSALVASVIMLCFGTIAVVLWVGGHDVMAGNMTAGDLSSFIFYSVVTAVSLVSICQIVGQVQITFAEIERIFSLLKIESPVKESLQTTAFPDAPAVKIKFEQVNFTYPSRKDHVVLRNFNLEIPAGEKIAIVGSSGSGKTTIFQLLLRFYDVDSGMIQLNDVDIKALSFVDLRKNFSYISQDCFIFSGTVFDNIAYVDKSVTREEVNKIISDHPTLNFINELPLGLDSYVGEKGVTLSGGERQRVAIIRAIIKDSPILLLDEATSALDTHSEQSIVRLITSLAKQKTVITIAHKLSSIIFADRIVFIKDGEIAEAGSHRELMIKNGIYKKLYDAETVGIIE